MTTPETPVQVPVEPPTNDRRIPTSIPLPDAIEHVRLADGEWEAAHRRLLLALTESCRNVVASKVNDVDGLLNRWRSGLEGPQELRAAAENDLARMAHAVRSTEAASANGVLSHSESEFLGLPASYTTKLGNCQDDMDRIVGEIQDARSDIEHIRGLWQDGDYLGTVESALVDAHNGRSPDKINQEMLDRHRTDHGLEHGFPLTAVDSDRLSSADQAVAHWQDDGRDDFDAARVAARDWIQNRWRCYWRLVIGRSM